MDDLNLYDIITTVYKSRFLFRTDAEYRETFGTSFETVASKRDSQRDMEMYYSILSRESALNIDNSLDELISDYIIASKLYTSIDWGDRTQLASRKKFCRMLFRLCISADNELSIDDIFKFRTKDADKDLLKIFLNGDVEDAPIVIICFILLFTFGIIRPRSTDNTRSRDIRDKETILSLRKLGELISILRDDTPRLGSLDKPLAFDDWLANITSHLNQQEDLSECTPLMMLTSLVDIMTACRTLVFSKQLRISNSRFYGLYLHGIWVDDEDNGNSRFWIFPDNFLYAMRYSHNGISWELDIFDFRVRDALHPDYMDTFMLTEANCNLNYTLYPTCPVSQDDIFTECFEKEIDENSDEIIRVTFHEMKRKFPKWLNWRKWERVHEEDPRYKKFRNVLDNIYDFNNPHSVIFRNNTAEISDIVNNLIAHDNKYIYIYDWHPKRFLIREKRHNIFTYNGDCERYATQQAIFELDISEENPLYAVPKDMKMKNEYDAELQRLVRLMEDADNIHEAYIIHSTRIKFPRLIFPTYGVSVALNMDELKKTGILKFTKSPMSL